MKIVKNSLSRDVTTQSLPQDIIEEILSRLAVEPLLKFRCVSKSWLSLIDSQRFMKTHYQNSTNNPYFPHQRYILHPQYNPPMQCSLQNLLSEKPTKPSTCDYLIDIDWTSIKRLGCYNGLVCILDLLGHFIVWNPSTRIANKLPEHRVEPLHSIVEYPGFGWIESTGEYKVFVVVRNRNDRQQAKVFSSKTKSWKTLQHWDLPFYCCQAGMCVTEKLHWDTRQGIVCFDLKSEVIGTIALPSKLDGEHPQLTLGVIGGCLSAVYQYNDERGIRVWVMKESWERVVSLPQLLELLQRPYSCPLMVGPNGQILMLFGSGYLIYYPQANGFLFPMFMNLYGFRYIESLVSPEVV